MNKVQYLRRSLHFVLPLLALALLVLPALVVAQQGWLSSASYGTTGLERWTLLAVAYVPWGAAVLFGFIWCMDHLGSHWRAYDRPPRTRRERRRLVAALRLDHVLGETRRERSVWRRGRRR